MQNSARFCQVLSLLTPLVTVPEWGIGGSLLLTERQLLNDFRDIDLVCSEAVVMQLDAQLQRLSTVLPAEVHPHYCSRWFRRYQHESGLVIELMAGIQVRNPQLTQWQFHPATLEQRHGLPWMRLADWLELYQLFDRPQRAQLIRAALAVVP